MKQDVRELFKQEENKVNPRLKKDHEARFLSRLEKELPQKKKNNYLIFKIAATVLLVLSVCIYTYNNGVSDAPIKTTIVDRAILENGKQGISLGDLSPDLKKVESYYQATIQLSLSNLQVSEENKALVDSYMFQMSELDKEYKILNTELNTLGPNDQTISALIQNLQLRLKLLQKLQKKLKQLKSSKNEQII